MRLFSVMLVLDREEVDTFLIIKELFAELTLAPCLGCAAHMILSDYVTSDLSRR